MLLDGERKPAGCSCAAAGSASIEAASSAKILPFIGT
jgi:hypothetical protein